VEPEEKGVVMEWPINAFPLQQTRDITIEELLELVFYIGSSPKLHIYSIQPIERVREEVT
jgi:hypothetical protein